MELITKQINFEEFLEYKQGPIRQRVVFYNDFLFGHGMKVLRFQLYHNDKEVCSCYGNENGDIKFKRIFDGFMKEVESDLQVFNNIKEYAKQTEEARRFTVISEKEYEKLEIKQNEIKGFKNRTRYRSFTSNGGKYLISVDVNMCEQMEFLCSVIPRSDRQNWYFVATPLYESSQSEEFLNELADLDKKITNNKNKTILELEKRFSLEEKNSTKSKRKKQTRKNKQNQSSLNKRNPDLVIISKLIANGVCELADSNGEFHSAPFFEGYGPYLEMHHIKWLSKRGKDVLDNVVSLCPTCHRKMHIVDDKNDVKKLQEIAKTHVYKWMQIVEKARTESI